MSTSALPLDQASPATGTRKPAKRLSTAAMLLSEVMGAGLLSARQLREALSLPVDGLEAVCRGDVALPTAHQRALALVVIERGDEFPDLVRRAHRLLGQTEAALRVEAGNTQLHSLAPVYWR